MSATVQQLGLESIKPSKTNPRRVVNGHALDELTQSVKEHGVLQPILVRPNGKGYEIVAGHRRYAAAEKAGLETLPVFVRELTDEQALELQLIENLERSDLHPLEEAQGYQQLIAVHKYDVTRIAEKIGRSIKYVYDRVKLLQLVPAAKDLFLEDKITAGHAILLARLSPKDQKRAIESRDRYRPALFQFEEQRGLFDRTEKDAPVKPRSVREFQGWIDEHVRFDAKEPDPILFPETKAELEGAKKIVPITRAHHIAEEAREGRTWGPRSWKRADGQPEREGYSRRMVPSKTCEYSVTGFVAVGPGRGEAFPVCVNKEKCRTHWGAEIREREKRHARKTSTSTSSSAKKASPKPQKPKGPQAWEIENEAASAVQEAVAAVAAKMSPEKFIRAIARVWLRHPEQLKASLPKLQERLALEVCDQVGDAPVFGVDPKPFLNAARARLAKSGSGTCSECGCTETTPCIDEYGDSCAWANKEKTLCTACAQKARKSGSGKTRAKKAKKK